MRRAFVALFLITAPIATGYGQASDELPHEMVVAVDSAVTTFMSRFQVPGLSIAVVRGNQIQLERGYGLSDLENFVPAKAATRYPIASITKSLTAVAALQLAEQGRLDLDAPIQTYVPEFPEKGGIITPRHLLRHTSGIRHYLGEEYTNTRHYESITESLEAFAGDSLIHLPGAAPTYSSYAYTLLGAAIERAAEMAFLEYLHQHVFEPAGMVATDANDVRRIIPNRSEGYEVLPSGELRNATFVDPSNRVPGGGLLSMAADMGRFTIALMEDKLVSQESYAYMTAPTPLPDGPIPLGAGWALGTSNWLSDRNPRPDALWSGGNILGSTSIVYMLPEIGISVSILTNLQDKGTDLLRLAYDIADAVSEHR